MYSNAICCCVVLLVMVFSLDAWLALCFHLYLLLRSLELFWSGAFWGFFVVLRDYFVSSPPCYILILFPLDTCKSVKTTRQSLSWLVTHMNCFIVLASCCTFSVPSLVIVCIMAKISLHLDCIYVFYKIFSLMYRSVGIDFLSGAGWTQFCCLSLEVSLQSWLKRGIVIKCLKTRYLDEISSCNHSENAW